MYTVMSHTFVPPGLRTEKLAAVTLGPVYLHRKKEMNGLKFADPITFGNFGKSHLAGMRVKKEKGGRNRGSKQARPSEGMYLYPCFINLVVYFSEGSSVLIINV